VFAALLRVERWRPAGIDVARWCSTNYWPLLWGYVPPQGELDWGAGMAGERWVASKRDGRGPIPPSG